MQDTSKERDYLAEFAIFDRYFSSIQIDYKIS